MGIGFTAALLAMGCIRELVGNGTLFGMAVTQGHIEPMLIMILPPGGFFVFGILIALANKITGKPVANTGCAACAAREFCGQAGKDEACASEKEETK